MRTARLAAVNGYKLNAACSRQIKRDHNAFFRSATVRHSTFSRSASRTPGGMGAFSVDWERNDCGFAHTRRHGVKSRLLTPRLGIPEGDLFLADAYPPQKFDRESSAPRQYKRNAEYGQAPAILTGCRTGRSAPTSANTACMIFSPASLPAKTLSWLFPTPC